MNHAVEADDLVFECKDGIGQITFNRPQARNAFTFAMYERLALFEPVGGTACAFAREDGVVDRNADGDRDDVTPLLIVGGRAFDVPLALDPVLSGVVWAGGRLVR